MGYGEKKDKLETRRQPGKPHIFPVACTVAVKFPRSTEKTEVKLKWGVEDNEALHLGVPKWREGDILHPVQVTREARQVEVEGAGGG